MLLEPLVKERILEDYKLKKKKKNISDATAKEIFDNALKIANDPELRQKTLEDFKSRGMEGYFDGIGVFHLQTELYVTSKEKREILK